jgi:hypothetical protein
MEASVDKSRADAEDHSLSCPSERHRRSVAEYDDLGLGLICNYRASKNLPRNRMLPHATCPGAWRCRQYRDEFEIISTLN